METVKPDRIMQLIWAYIPQRALTTAVDLGLFTHLARGAGTAADVAAAAGADERGVRMILDVLAALGLVTKDGHGYGLTPESETFLVIGQPGYLGALAQHTDLLWPTFGQLTEVVRTGRPTRSLENQADGTEFFQQLVPQIFAMTFPQARAAAEALDVGGAWRGLTVLDLGAGTAAWSIAMLQRDATSRAVAVDYPGVLEVTREFTARYGVADRFEYRSGNLRDVDYGDDSCDLAVLGHICHTEGAASSQELFARIHRALRPGGKLLIADMVPDDDRTGPAFPLIFALNMLVHSDEGDTFTMAEYTAWLTAAGYQRVWTIPAPGPSPLIVAER